MKGDFLGEIMTFSSLFFVLFFLPLFLLVYYKVPAIERKNKVLLIFSLIFYVWSGIRYFLLLLAMTAIGWYFALQIQRQDKKDARRRKCWLIFAILLFLTVLGIFKYTGFFMDTLDIVFPISWNFPTFVLPLGISFYTFKLISYIADTYKGIVEAESSYLALLLYTSLFHHCTAGPIVRYAPFRKELADRSATVSSIADGLCRFCVGLAKKSILADHCGVLANSLLPLSGHLSGTPASGIWLGSLLYMLQIYLDFSAYSDMAIGLGWMV
ncbi:MAG: MBOAT family protein, partial [Clostridiales bacterium]|nr:MBOAT family protein [Clostridiales bacterium]